MAGQRTVCAAVLLTVALAACSGAGGDAAAEAEASESYGPLAEFFGDADWDPEEYEARERAVQEEIAACMRAEGFEYVPFVFPQDSAGTADEEELSEAEYAAENGFGYFTWDEQDEQGEQQAAGAQPEVVDPNAEIQERLSPEDQEAYNRTLYGAPVEEPEDGEGLTLAPEDAGCDGRARGLADPAAQEAQEALQPKYDELYDRIQSDPRMVEADQAWSACMAERGHRFATPEDIFTFLDGEHQQLYAEQNAFYEQLETGAGTGSQTEPAFDEADVPQIDEARRQELAETEIAIAVADVECRAEHLPPELAAEISAEYERAFIAENRELLEQTRGEG